MIVLITACVIGMIYSGGFFSGVGFVEAFSGSDASVGLMYGSFFALVITIIYYMFRRVLKFSESMSCIPEGFKAMVPAILILTFAWTLKAMTDSLGAKEFVAELVKSTPDALLSFLPALVFIIACFLAFATGTSWGTFGMLIPIVVNAFEGTNATMMIISISACMAGAVCACLLVLDHILVINNKVEILKANIRGYLERIPKPREQTAAAVRPFVVKQEMSAEKGEHADNDGSPQTDASGEESEGGTMQEKESAASEETLNRFLAEFFS